MARLVKSGTTLVCKVVDGQKTKEEHVPKPIGEENQLIVQSRNKQRGNPVFRFMQLSLSDILTASRE